MKLNTRVKIASIAILGILTLNVLAQTFPPCAYQYENINPGSAVTLGGCLAACDILCPGPPPGSPPPGNVQHTKCYQGCHASYD